MRIRSFAVNAAAKCKLFGKIKTGEFYSPVLKRKKFFFEWINKNSQKTCLEKIESVYK